MEKVDILPLSSLSRNRPEEAKKFGTSLRRLAIFAGLVWIVLAATKRFNLAIWELPDAIMPGDGVFDHLSDDKLCSQYDVLVPKNPLWKTIGQTLDTEEFKAKAVAWLAGAVKVPSESYDHMEPVGVDPRWETFGEFHEYLLEAFPMVHSTLSLTKVNTYGLLYEWTASDPSLQPILLAAHQDVVPVDPKTADEWVHPPYSGFFDGEAIWGRGSVDDKSGLIGVMVAIEAMLKSGFKPTRTVVLAFGFDEESSGHYGAAELGKAMLDVYGEDAFAFVVDEGGGFSELYDTVFAVAGIAEKGYMDVRVDVASPGGHSSVPPVHTTIGLLSKLVVAYEDNPYPVELTRDSILYGTLQCYAGHGTTIPADLRETIKRSTYSKKALRQLGDMLFSDPAMAALVGTTQAIDLIQGGVKTNALPEQAYAVINHRISTLSSVEETMKHDIETVRALAEEFNLTFTAFGQDISDPTAPAYGTLVLSSAFGNNLEPAPITPTFGPTARPYELLAGTIKATYNAQRSLEGANNIVIAPGMPTGNTDTKYYWSLSKHIFRYNHRNAGKSKNRLAGGVHTVNENIKLEAFLEIIRFYTTLILNADDSVIVL